MTKAIGGMLPWAAALAAAGGAIWWLLSREMAAGRWALAAVLVGHGMVHAMFVAPSAPATGSRPGWPFDLDSSWVVGGAGLDPNAGRIVGLALIAVVVAGFALAALATVGFLVPPGWWRATVAAAALSSAVLLIVFFDPQLVLGLGIDAGLLWVAVARAWVP